MLKPIYLCGFMGCGKSYYAGKAKELYGCEIVDLDGYIIQTEKLSIPKIFEKKGVGYFRECEYNALKTLNETNAQRLVALGGGALTNEKCAAYARENAVVIFINTDFDVCFERIRNDSNRPNAFGKSREELYALYSSRIGIYKNSADYILGSEPEILAEIGNLLKIRKI